MADSRRVVRIVSHVAALVVVVVVAAAAAASSGGGEEEGRGEEEGGESCGIGPGECVRMLGRSSAM